MKSKNSYKQNISNNDSFNNELEEIDIEKTAEKLVRCGNNRLEFESYIKKINTIILGEENLDSSNNIKKNDSYDLKTSLYKSDRSNARQLINKGSVSPSFTETKNTNNFRGYDKSPNSKKFKMEDNNDNDNSRSTNNLKITNKSNFKSSLVSNNLRYNDVNANSKFYYPVDSNSAYDSDLSNEPAPWNDRSNRNTLFESRKLQQDETRGRQEAKYI